MDLRLARRLRIPLAAALVAAASLACVLAAEASAAPLRGAQGASWTRIGRAPAIPAGASAQGRLPRSSVIDASVALVPRHPGAMTAYAQSVSTPGSPLYHHYLSVAQFAQRFGPTAAEVASVRAALQAQGLHPGVLAANGLSMDVTASAARLSSAFATSFRRYRVRSGRTAFANTTAPAVPTAVAGLVRGVIGLDSVQTATPAGVDRRPTTRTTSQRTVGAKAAPGSSGACRQLIGTSGNTADQIASAYGLDDLYAGGDGGNGTTIALFELESYSANDIAGYQRCYGTSTSVTNVNVDGGPDGTSEPGCAGCEATLDIEDLIGLAPQASILVYQGPNTVSGAYDTYRAIVSQHRAAVVSTSWGLCEPLQGSSAAEAENDLFIEAVTQGQSVFAASGDAGVRDCAGGASKSSDPTLKYRTVDDPASQPWVTGVGGTSLTSAGPPPDAWVWNNSAGAGGGGVSSFWGAPSYQAGVTIPQSAVTCVVAHSTSCREVPDVSADADPSTGYDVLVHGNWYEMGGTSAAAPTWAALAGLANSSAACGGRTVGFANPALYQAASTAYGTYFNDITSGDNSYGSLSGFSAGSGYDMATGLGSPKGAAIAAALCGSNWTPPVTSTTTTSAPTQAPTSPGSGGRPVVTLTKPATQKARVGQPVHMQLRANDSAGQKLSWRAAGLPPGLSISKTTGAISGTPTKAGKATASIRASDTSGSSATAGIAWSVAGRPTITGGLTVKRGKPSLAVRVVAGANAPAIQSIVIVPSSQIRFARRSRDLTRGITVRNPSGHRLANGARLRGGDLVVTLRSKTVRTASVRVTVPAVALVKPKKKTKAGKQRPAAQTRITVTVTDVGAFRTALSVR